MDPFKSLDGVGVVNLKILLIEDDEEIINTISLTLKVGWPEAELVSATQGAIGFELAGTESPDLIILDLGLPDVSGFEVLQDIRRFSDVPIVILTVNDKESSIVKGLELGANEYLIKPFRQIELLARLKAIAKGLYQPSEIETRLKIGEIEFIPSSRIIKRNNITIHVPPTESTILLHLFRNQGKAVTYRSIALKLWAQEPYGYIEAIRVYVKNLRAKIESDPSHPKIIRTALKVGYLLSIEGK